MGIDNEIDHDDGISVMAEIEAAAFEARAFVGSVQVVFDVGAGLLAALGLGLLTVTGFSMASEDVRNLSIQLALAVAVVAWVPAAVLIHRFTRPRSGKSPEREFRKFMDEFPRTANMPVTWSKAKLTQKDVAVLLKELKDGSELRNDLIAAYACARLNIGLPLAAAALAVAGVCAFVSVVAKAGLSSVLWLLVSPAAAAVVLLCTALFVPSTAGSWVKKTG